MQRSNAGGEKQINAGGCGKENRPEAKLQGGKNRGTT